MRTATRLWILGIVLTGVTPAWADETTYLPPPRVGKPGQFRVPAQPAPVRLIVEPAVAPVTRPGVTVIPAGSFATMPPVPPPGASGSSRWTTPPSYDANRPQPIIERLAPSGQIVDGIDGSIIIDDGIGDDFRAVPAPRFVQSDRTFRRRWFAYPMLDTMPQGDRTAIPHEARGRAGLLTIQGGQPTTGTNFAFGGPLARSIPDIDAGAPTGHISNQGGMRVLNTEVDDPATPDPLNLFGVQTPWYLQGNTMVVFGGTTVNDKVLGRLQPGQNDPKERGFFVHEVNIEAGVTSFNSYFGGDIKLSSVLDGNKDVLDEVELDQAALWWDSDVAFAMHAGEFRAPFGNENMYHENAWLFLDSPMVRTRILGNDGFNSLGVDVAFHDEASRWRFHFGAQDAYPKGNSLPGFNGAGLGGIWHTVDSKGDNFADLIYHARAAHVFALCAKRSAMQLGASLVYGSNATGEHGTTLVYGADMRIDFVDPRRVTKTNPGLRGQIVAEYMRRDISTDDFSGMNGMLTNTLAKTDLEDWGYYIQGIWSPTGNAAFGLRWDHVGAKGNSFEKFDDMTGAAVFVDRDQDFGSFGRTDRKRISALAILPIPIKPKQMSGFGTAKPVMRLRIQYSYDMADFLPGDEAHTLWIGFETGVGVKSKAAAGN